MGYPRGLRFGAADSSIRLPQTAPHLLCLVADHALTSRQYNPDSGYRACIAYWNVCRSHAYQKAMVRVLAGTPRYVAALQALKTNPVVAKALAGCRKRRGAGRVPDSHTEACRT